MKIARNINVSLAMCSIGAHFDYTKMPCDHCRTTHDLFGLSIGFVFVRVLAMWCLGCEADDERAA